MAASTTLTVTFDEAPLIRELDTTAAWVSGEAEITVWDHNDWSITAIFIDAHDKKTNKRTMVELERTSWMFLTIHAELEANWKDNIEDRIADLIGEAA